MGTQISFFKRKIVRIGMYLLSGVALMLVVLGIFIHFNYSAESVQRGTTTVDINFADKRGVFFWRALLIPLIESFGGKSYPAGKVKEFAYGDLPLEKLDYIAPDASSKQQVAVVHIHGGGWIAGSKGSFYSAPLLKFSKAGYGVFSLNYPLAPEHQHPYILHSVLKGLAWIKKHYPQYKEIHLIGDSAGGNLAMMSGIYIANPDLLKKLSSMDSNAFPQIKTIVDIYGVNDRTSWVEDGFPSAALFLKAYLEHTKTPEIPAIPMDFEYIKNLPPTFVVGAGEDKLLRSSKIWAEHIRKQFSTTEFKIYKGASHGFFCFGKKCEEVSSDMLTFFKKY